MLSISNFKCFNALKSKVINPSGVDDKFRSSFLWGRKPMLAACAARLADQKDLIWVDLGGGTGVRLLPDLT